MPRPSKSRPKPYIPGLGNGRSRSGAKIRTPLVQTLQGMAFAREMALGTPMTVMEEKYGVSRDTIERRLSFIERAGLFTKHEDVILQQMVPLAEGVLIKALQEGDVDVAKEVFKGTGLFRRPGQQAPSMAGEQVGMSLDDQIRLIREKAQRQLEATEGEVIPTSAPRLLTAVAGEVVEEPPPEAAPTPVAQPSLLDLL